MLQGGHLGVTSGATGAPGEQELTRRIRDRLSQILLSKKNADGSPAFQLFLVDAHPPANQLAEDFDLFLALHGDADYPGDNGSGFADFPEPSTDHATKESQRICKVINDVYFPHSGIKYVSHSNANTRFYYMWSRLSAKTPCVILEMGQVQDPHDKVILADTDRVCNAIARAICQAFNVPFDVAPPQPPTEDWKKKYEDEVNAHTATKEAFKKYKEDAATDKANAVKAETERCRVELRKLADRL